MELRAKVELGGNPLEERQTLRTVPTLASFIQDVYVPHIKVHRRNFQSTLSFIKCHILPRFGAKHLDAITSNMVAEAHADLRGKGYALAQANKLPILLKIMFNLAKKGIPGSQSNPTDSVVLFNPNNAKERYLSAAETQRLHEALSRCGSAQFKSIVALCCCSDAASANCWMLVGRMLIWSGATGAFLCPRAGSRETFRSLKGLWRCFKRCHVGKGALT